MKFVFLFIVLFVEVASVALPNKAASQDDPKSRSVRSLPVVIADPRGHGISVDLNGRPTGGYRPRTRAQSIKVDLNGRPRSRSYRPRTRYSGKPLLIKTATRDPGLRVSLNGRPVTRDADEKNYILRRFKRSARRPRPRDNQSASAHHRSRDDRPRDRGSSRARPRDRGSSRDRPRERGSSRARPRDRGSSRARPRDRGSSRARQDRPRDQGSSRDRPRDRGSSRARPRDRGSSRAGQDRPMDQGSSRDRPRDKGPSRARQDTPRDNAPPSDRKNGPGSTAAPRARQSNSQSNEPFSEKYIRGRGPRTTSIPRSEQDRPSDNRPSTGRQYGPRVTRTPKAKDNGPKDNGSKDNGSKDNQPLSDRYIRETTTTTPRPRQYRPRSDPSFSDKYLTTRIPRDMQQEQGRNAVEKSRLSRREAVLPKINQGQAVQAFVRKDKQAMAGIFRTADLNNDGYVKTGEMISLLQSNLAGYVDMPKVVQQINNADTNNDGNISFPEFCDAVKEQNPADSMRID